MTLLLGLCPHLAARESAPAPATRQPFVAVCRSCLVRCVPIRGAGGFAHGTGGCGWSALHLGRQVSGSVSRRHARWPLPLDSLRDCVQARPAPGVSGAQPRAQGRPGPHRRQLRLRGLQGGGVQRHVRSGPAPPKRHRCPRGLLLAHGRRDTGSPAAFAAAARGAGWATRRSRSRPT